MNPELYQIFDQIDEGILIIDPNGIVLYANTSYLKFIQHDKKEFFGKKLKDFRPHARLPEVVKSGKAVLHAQRVEDLEEAYFVNMYPLFEKGQIVGGISVITFMDAALRARVELNKFEEKNQQLLRKVNQQNHIYTFDQIVAVDQASISMKNYALKLSEGDMTILLESESGTGKELYAQAIHNASPRKNKVFLAVNCAGFTKEMLESELFGYTDGAFTGAKKGGKIGLFEAANGGTLFLDEIAELDISLQAKLLRVLQEHKIRPVGSVKEYDVDVRIICACNADLKKRVEQGMFRLDLYYRLSVFPIHIPALRDRREDIPALAQQFAGQIGEKLKKTFTFSEAAIDTMLQYDWPGNVRELKNIVEFSCYFAHDQLIDIEHLPDQIRLQTMTNNSTLSLAERVRQFERQEIENLLKQYGHSVDAKKKIAKILNISLASLYNKINNF